MRVSEWARKGESIIANEYPTTVFYATKMAQWREEWFGMIKARGGQRDERFTENAKK